MGIPLIYGSSPRWGESEPSPGGRFPTLHSSCGQEHSFHYHQVHRICPQAVRCWMLGFRSCATPLSTSRRGEPCANFTSKYKHRTSYCRLVQYEVSYCCSFNREIFVRIRVITARGFTNAKNYEFSRFSHQHKHVPGTVRSRYHTNWFTSCYNI